MDIYGYGNSEAGIVLIQPVDDHDLSVIESELSHIREMTAVDFQLMAASPSIWYPRFQDYRKAGKIMAGTADLSLGDREEKSRNPVMVFAWAVEHLARSLCSTAASDILVMTEIESICKVRKKMYNY